MCLCVGNVRVLVMYCGNVQHIVVLKLTFCKICGNALEIHFEGSDKATFVLGNELWEEHYESLLGLVKEYIIGERNSR